MALCPVCQQKTRVAFRWEQSWRCETCGSKLKLGLEAPHPALVALLSLVPFLREIIVVERSPGFCAGCGYNLHGNTTDRCPECGRQVEAGPSGHE